ncbi:MAG: MFS transporter [Acidimicrobiaceae bacterium]|nr:MFS transporter [Acidimicrobiaceae bacterium]
MNVPVATAERSQPFVRGWVVLAGVFGVMMITSGMVFYALGAFLDAFVDEQGFSTGLAGAGVGIFLLASGVCGYYTGKLVNRFDARWVITAGTAVSTVGMALLAQVRSGWQMFVVMTVFGIGFGLCGLVPTTTLVTRWFERRRSVAMAISSTGLSLGGIVLLPQLSRRIESASLVHWAPRFAVVYCVLLLISTWFFIRAWPKDVGLQPDGVRSTNGSGETPAGPPPGTPYQQAIRTRFFVFTAIGFVLVMSSQVGAIQHMYKFTGDRLGLETAAAGAVQVLAGMSVVARICGGVAALKVSLRWLTMVLMAVQTVGLCMLAVAGSGLAILFGVLVLGSAMGNLLMLHPLILADAFGVKDYSRIYGFGSLLMVSGLAGGPFLTGVINDAYSYRSAFFTLAAIAVAGLIVYSFAGNPTRDYLTTRPPESERAARVRPRSSRPTPTPVLAVTRNLDEEMPQPVLAGNGINGALQDAAELDEIEQTRRRTAPAVWLVESA